jgi:hypothetical protein
MTLQHTAAPRSHNTAYHQPNSPHKHSIPAQVSAPATQHSFTYSATYLAGYYRLNYLNIRYSVS